MLSESFDKSKLVISHAKTEKINDLIFKMDNYLDLMKTFVNWLAFNDLAT